MENTFLNGNHLIKERISAFRAEPTTDSYGAVFEQMIERMAEDGHFLIPCQIAEEEQENPAFYFQQIQTADGTTFVLMQGDTEWKEGELPEKMEKLQPMRRLAAERLEDFWRYTE